MPQVFPDFAVKQAFQELDIERADDAIIASIQSDLVTRCLIIVLKGSLVHCELHKRKYINQSDMQYAMDCCVLPRSNRKSSELGYLLDTREFGHMCASHVRLLVNTLHKLGMECGEAKLSHEMLLLLQDQVESLIRAFLETIVRNNQGRQIGYRLFDEYMFRLMGEPLMETNYISSAE